MDNTPYLCVVPQRHNFDCAVACVAMLLGKDYETTLLAFNSLRPLVSGVSIAQVKRAARVLGTSLQHSRRTVDLEHSTGILAVSAKGRWASDHLVVLKEGLIIDTDATIWEADVFLQAYDAKVLSILTKEGEE